MVSPCLTLSPSHPLTLYPSHSLIRLHLFQGPEFDIEALDELLLSRMFVVPSFEIYNGVSGFYDFGPPACAFKSNLLALWRRHFVLEENMLEIEWVLAWGGGKCRLSGCCRAGADSCLFSSSVSPFLCVCVRVCVCFSLSPSPHPPKDHGHHAAGRSQD